MSFGEYVKSVRGERTQAALAKALGISPQYLCDVERGQRKPSVTFTNQLVMMCRLDQAATHKLAAAEHGWKL